MGIAPTAHFNYELRITNYELERSEEVDAKLIEICKWDFLSYDEAFKAFGQGQSIIQYYSTINLEDLAVFSEKAPQNLMEYEIHTLNISQNDFGLYSWIPSKEEDKTCVKEHKVTINLYSTYKHPSSDFVEWVKSLISTFFKEERIEIGINCVGKENFIIVFPSLQKKPAIYFNFIVPQEFYWQKVVSKNIEIYEVIAGSGNVRSCTDDFKVLTIAEKLKWLYEEKCQP